MDKKYLLVCEGQTDYFVINEISKSISNNIGRKVIITPLSPSKMQRPALGLNMDGPQSETGVDYMERKQPQN